MGSGSFQHSDVLYSFVPQPVFVDFTVGFGSFFMDTTQSGSILIAVLIGVSQVLLMRQTQQKGVGDQRTNKILVYILPVFISLISLSIAATIGIYWLFNNLISILQEIGIKWFRRGGDSVSSVPSDSSPLTPCFLTFVR